MFKKENALNFGILPFVFVSLILLLLTAPVEAQIRVQDHPHTRYTLTGVLEDTTGTPLTSSTLTVNTQFKFPYTITANPAIERTKNAREDAIFTIGEDHTNLDAHTDSWDFTLFYDKSKVQFDGFNYIKTTGELSTGLTTFFNDPDVSPLNIGTVDVSATDYLLAPFSSLVQTDVRRPTPTPELDGFKQLPVGSNFFHGYVREMRLDSCADAADFFNTNPDTTLTKAQISAAFAERYGGSANARCVGWSYSPNIIIPIMDLTRAFPGELQPLLFSSSFSPGSFTFTFIGNTVDTLVGVWVKTPRLLLDVQEDGVMYTNPHGVGYFGKEYSLKAPASKSAQIEIVDSTGAVIVPADYSGDITFPSHNTDAVGVKVTIWDSTTEAAVPSAQVTLAEFLVQAGASCPNPSTGTWTSPTTFSDDGVETYTLVRPTNYGQTLCIRYTADAEVGAARVQIPAAPLSDPILADPVILPSTGTSNGYANIDATSIKLSACARASSTIAVTGLTGVTALVADTTSSTSCGTATTDAYGYTIHNYDATIANADISVIGDGEHTYTATLTSAGATATASGVLIIDETPPSYYFSKNNW